MSKKILQKIFNREPEPFGYYCYKCGVQDVKPIVTKRGEEFLCVNQHRSPRVYFFDNKAITDIRNGKLAHATIGAIIRKSNAKEPLFLLFLRKKYPFLYTIPAGHIEDLKNLHSELEREVLEETSLTVIKSKQLWSSLELFDPCRRGADIHDWYVFEVICEGEPRLSEEGKLIGWFSKEEIQRLEDKDLLTLPVRFIFKKYFESYS